MPFVLLALVENITLSLILECESFIWLVAIACSIIIRKNPAT